MELLSEYIVPIILATCLAIGFIIKHSIKIIPNDFIPLILGIIGVILNSWANKWQFDIAILLGGLASGLASTGLFELRKGLSKQLGDD